MLRILEERKELGGGALNPPKNVLTKPQTTKKFLPGRETWDCFIYLQDNQGISILFFSSYLFIFTLSW